MADETLGKLMPWQIKEFPEGLRRELTEQARQADLTVGEWLTRIVVAFRDAGWPMDGLPPGAMARGFANAQPTVKQHSLQEIVDMASRVAPHLDGGKLPKALSGAIASKLRAEIKGLPQTAQSNAGKRVLPAPEAEGDDLDGDALHKGFNEAARRPAA